MNIYFLIESYDLLTGTYDTVTVHEDKQTAMDKGRAICPDKKLFWTRVVDNVRKEGGMVTDFPAGSGM